jgi:hypothetical protein
LQLELELAGGHFPVQVIALQGFPSRRLLVQGRRLGRGGWSALVHRVFQERGRVRVERGLGRRPLGHQTANQAGNQKGNPLSVHAGIYTPWGARRQFSF